MARNAKPDIDASINKIEDTEIVEGQTMPKLTGRLSKILDDMIWDLELAMDTNDMPLIEAVIVRLTDSRRKLKTQLLIFFWNPTIIWIIQRLPRRNRSKSSLI